mgnify:CR=1 FL=1
MRVHPRAVYPFNKKLKGNEEKRRNSRAKLSHVGFAKGPRGVPGTALSFYGQRKSFVEIPNGRRGMLDTIKSITILAWVRYDGRSGPIIQYNRNFRGPQLSLWMFGPTKLVLRLTTRYNSRKTKSVSANLYRRWNFVGITYEKRTGILKLLANRRFKKVYVGKFNLATQFPVRLGAVRGYPKYFRGRVACLQIYGRKLNAWQIAKRRKKCLSRKFDSH